MKSSALLWPFLAFFDLDFFLVVVFSFSFSFLFSFLVFRFFAGLPPPGVATGSWSSEGGESYQHSCLAPRLIHRSPLDS